MPPSAPILAPRGLSPRYFRHPFLFTGRDQATKRAVSAFLGEHGYAVAPVSVDNSDWVFARAYARVTGAGRPGLGRKGESCLPRRICSPSSTTGSASPRPSWATEVKQVLLIHASALNADSLGDLAAMMKGRGYSFVTLDHALTDPAYALPDGYEGGAGISWLHRWAFALGGKSAILAGEPRCPAWVMEAAGVDSE